MWTDVFAVWSRRQSWRRGSVSVAVTGNAVRRMSQAALRRPRGQPRGSGLAVREVDTVLCCRVRAPPEFLLSLLRMQSQVARKLDS